MDLSAEIHRLFYLEGVEAGMAKLEEVVQNLEGFSKNEQERWRNWHLTWKRAVDFDYKPSAPSHEMEVVPLWLRYTFCGAAHPAEAERALWGYIQHCAFGTKSFQDALAMLTEFAVNNKNFKLARHAAEILLHHYAILNLIRFNPLVPVGDRVTLNGREWPADDGMPIDLPYWAAIEALKEDTAQCWLDILELRLEITPPEDRAEYFYPSVLQALRSHYTETKNVARLEWLKVYEVS